MRNSGGRLAGLVVLMLATARWQRLAGLAVWVAAAAVLAVYLAPKGHAALLGAAAVAGLAVAAIGAYLLRRWPWLLALATLACVPARIPVTIGSTQANLLVPLYGVVAAAAFALAWDFLRGDESSRELGPVALPLAAFVAWTGLSLAARRGPSRPATGTCSSGSRWASTGPPWRAR